MNSIKTEVNERLDVFAGQMAQLRDTAILQEKCLAENLKKMETSFESTVKLLSQAVRPSPPHMDNRLREKAEERREPSLTRTWLVISVTVPTISGIAGTRTNL
jgi:hypothetical protein